MSLIQITFANLWSVISLHPGHDSVVGENLIQECVCTLSPHQCLLKSFHCMRLMQGEAQTYFDHAMTLRDTIRYLRHNPTLGIPSDNGRGLGLDLLRTVGPLCDIYVGDGLC